MERFDPREAAVTHHMNNGLTQLQAEHLADATQYDSPALDEYSSALQARSDAGYKKLNPMAEYDFMESLIRQHMESLTHWTSSQQERARTLYLPWREDQLTNYIGKSNCKV
jgi:hypothetical protein